MQERFSTAITFGCRVGQAGLGLLIAVIAGCGNEVPEPEAVVRPVKIFEVGSELSRRVQAYPGAVRATRGAEVGFEVQGRIVRLDAKEGQRVEPGELLAALEQRGYAVAIDERDFPVNASFLNEMERCIRASRYTLAVISPRYVGSGHCEEEAVLCKVLDMGDRRRRLIPLIIEPVVLPAWLFGIVGIDWTAPEPLVDPLERLIATLGPPLAEAD